MDKVRLDVYLTRHGFFASREKAKNAILEGLVMVNGKTASVTKQLVDENDVFVIQTSQQAYVGRGAYKLKHAIDSFGISLAGKIVLDIGASTGGFTQVVLEHGVAKVYALDVGSNQLDASIRNHERVVVMEHRNFRYAEASWFDEKADFVCCDVSFISLKHIIPALACVSHDETEYVFLVKPQFEAGKDHVNKHGVVTSKAVHKRVIHDVWAELQENDIIVQHLAISPITGKDGNIEYLLHAAKHAGHVFIDVAKLIDTM